MSGEKENTLKQKKEAKRRQKSDKGRIKRKNKGFFFFFLKIERKKIQCEETYTEVCRPHR